MTTTAYFRDNVLGKRPYLTEAMCREIVNHPIRTLVQADGRIRRWGFVESLG